MKTIVRALMFLLAILAITAQAAVPSFDGEYVDRKFLHGEAVFQLSVQQSGNAISVAFDAAYSDAHGATPEGTGEGKASGQTAKFSWKDSGGNQGHGTLTMNGPDVVTLMLQPTKTGDARCMVFYGQKIQVKRIGKK